MIVYAAWMPQFIQHEPYTVLSAAYNTLSQPTKKLSYDTHQRSAGLDHYTTYCSEDNAVDVFQQVIRQVIDTLWGHVQKLLVCLCLCKQLYIEIMEGEFQTLRTVIREALWI